MGVCKHDFVLVAPRRIVQGIKDGELYDGMYVVCTKCYGIKIIKLEALKE